MTWLTREQILDLGFTVQQLQDWTGKHYNEIKRLPLAVVKGMYKEYRNA